MVPFVSTVLAVGFGLLLSHPASTNASPSFSPPPAARGRPNGTTSRLEARQKNTYYLVDDFSGPNFFDGFDVWNGPDPTHGAVNYIGADESWRKGLMYIGKDGLPVIQADSWSYLPYGVNRDSVRITTKKAYDGGLFILDFAHVPWGCTTWPAAWTVGENWPNNGEIDIWEGQNQQQTNMMALHSSSGCYLTNPGVFSGSPGSTDCSASSGCQIFETPSSSRGAATFGSAFNAQGGGVFALLWDGDGMKIWSFPAGGVPQDVEQGRPSPEGWGIPNGAWAPTSCDPYRYFRRHQVVVNIALCGDWAGDSGAYPTSGCPGSCLSTLMDPSVYKEAYFKFNSIRIYSATGLEGQVLGLGTSYNNSIIGGPLRSSARPRARSRWVAGVVVAVASATALMWT